ncbi:pimeloyl-ACP methyl ester carboxylesterase [Deinobacterium chartae]|uniref:Pimeloyl-ACP methyl ester carboxylesterase n=1 Tax=Deinobacterium chartae TaxID=521158 RepID=A0A841I273_9DEIO|nr:alpha/beta fold hydrolase [Deinobacterium chartae]MBB6098152.1 pimeloyl-ACP methyl ester carboxylesterase [Deinobacterium chartae]
MKVFRHGERRLSYRSVGKGPPLVLIHGLSGSHRWWRRNLPVLTPHFTVYLVDLVGFGASRSQRPLPIRESADLLAAWLDAHSLERVRVMGHSMGGHTALHLAAAHPERVLRQVLVAPSGLVRGTWWQLMLKLPQAGISGSKRFLATIAADALRAGLPTLFQATLEVLGDDVSELLGLLEVPTLLVWGGRDVLVTRPLAETFSRIPGSELVILPSAGHVVMYDRAEEFNRAVLPFLQKEESR